MESDKLLIHGQEEQEQAGRSSEPVRNSSSEEAEGVSSRHRYLLGESEVTSAPDR